MATTKKQSSAAKAAKPQQAKKQPTTAKTKAAKSASLAKKAPAKKATTTKTPAAKPPAKKQPPAKATPAKTAAGSAKEATKKTGSLKKATAAKKQPPAKNQAPAKAPADKPPAKAPATAAADRPAAVASREASPGHSSRPAGPGLLSRRDKPVEKRTEGYTDERWLNHQRHLLEEERATYVAQAAALRAEAESLVEEMEPGDIQFDDESGEGGTTTVDRERDLALSAQALQAVEEIDHALAKIANKTYGICENCGRLIPKPRLEALPYARLCIDCKSGGLSRR